MCSPTLIGLGIGALGAQQQAQAQGAMAELGVEQAIRKASFQRKGVQARAQQEVQKISQDSFERQTQHLKDRATLTVAFGDQTNIRNRFQTQADIATAQDMAIFGKNINTINQAARNELDAIEIEEQSAGESAISKVPSSLVAGLSIVGGGLEGAAAGPQIGSIIDKGV